VRGREERKATEGEKQKEGEWRKAGVDEAIQADNHGHQEEATSAV